MKDELQDDRVVRRGSSGLRDLLKKASENFFKKKFSENLEDIRKTPYLCIRFPNETEGSLRGD